MLTKSGKNKDIPVEAKRRNFSNPGMENEENVIIAYPLDDEDRVEVGGTEITRIVEAVMSIAATNKLMFLELRLLNERIEEAFETTIEEIDT